MGFACRYNIQVRVRVTGLALTQLDLDTHTQAHLCTTSESSEDKDSRHSVNMTWVVASTFNINGQLMAVLMNSVREEFNSQHQCVFSVQCVRVAISIWAVLSLPILTMWADYALGWYDNHWNKTIIIRLAGYDYNIFKLTKQMDEIHKYSTPKNYLFRCVTNC